jgi:hypothetical protein
LSTSRGNPERLSCQNSVASGLAAVGLVALVFFGIRVPETSGRSLEEIEQQLERKALRQDLGTAQGSDWRVRFEAMKTPGRDLMATAPSGRQFEIASEEQRAWIVEVGGGLRAYSATCAPNAFQSGEGLVTLGAGETFASSWGIEPS